MWYASLERGRGKNHFFRCSVSLFSIHRFKSNTKKYKRYAADMIATGWMVLPYFFRFDQHTKRGNSSIFSYRWLRCDTFVDSVYLLVTKVENNDCDGVQTLDVGANIREWPTATFVQCWICNIQMIPRLRFSTDMNKHRIKKLMLYNQDQSFFYAFGADSVHNGFNAKSLTIPT